MIKQQGIWWPDTVGDKWEHALKHVRSIEWAIGRVRRPRRTAVQAGGNVGLWPLRMARDFARVFTFEPEPVSREVLEANIRDMRRPEDGQIIVSECALGDTFGAVGIGRKSLGSHKIQPAGAGVNQITIDSLKLDDLDLLQLDVEGYEWHALAGAVDTIGRCRPLIQVELRGFTKNYGKTDTEVWDLLGSLGYRLASQQPGSDFVFEFIA